MFDGIRRFITKILSPKKEESSPYKARRVSFDPSLYVDQSIRYQDQDTSLNQSKNDTVEFPLRSKNLSMSHQNYKRPTDLETQYMNCVNEEKII